MWKPCRITVVVREDSEAPLPGSRTGKQRRAVPERTRSPEFRQSHLSSLPCGLGADCCSILVTGSREPRIVGHGLEVWEALRHLGWK